MRHVDSDARRLREKCRPSTRYVGEIERLMWARGREPAGCAGVSLISPQSNPVRGEVRAYGSHPGDKRRRGSIGAVQSRGLAKQYSVDLSGSFKRKHSLVRRRSSKLRKPRVHGARTSRGDQELRLLSSLLRGCTTPDIGMAERALEAACLTIFFALSVR